MHSTLNLISYCSTYTYNIRILFCFGLDHAFSPFVAHFRQFIHSLANWFRLIEPMPQFEILRSDYWSPHSTFKAVHATVIGSEPSGHLRRRTTPRHEVRTVFYAQCDQRRMPIAGLRWCDSSFLFGTQRHAARGRRQPSPYARKDTWRMLFSFFGANGVWLSFLKTITTET